MQGTPQNVSSSSSKRRGKKKKVVQDRNTPIWFRLIASNHEDKNAPLEQLSKPYLRVKDNKLPVSYIKKYIVLKLNLQSEDEVELSIDNQPLDSSVMLKDLLQYWIAIADGDIIDAKVGASGEEYVMLLNYGRKSQPVA